ncbi:energy transducer TonB [Thiobacter aerophilum]|uniref:Protein TonB n=1 Tax=Thiobacter aerophilum TaxID=3121275 RepID=A0ABV0EH08_9BURK
MTLANPPARRVRDLPLAVALGLSALLHAALLLGVRVGQVERLGAATQRLEVHLDQVKPPFKPDTRAAPGMDAPPIRDAGSEAQAAQPLASPAEAPPAAARKAAETSASPAAADQDGALPRPGMPEAAAGRNTVDLPLPPDPTYYPARQVDEHPVLLSDTRPVYPEEAASHNVRGEVIVLMLLNEHGRADEVSIVEARPPGQGFEEAVIAWLRDARFKPAMRQGRAVKARVVYHVTFEP